MVFYYNVLLYWFNYTQRVRKYSKIKKKKIKKSSVSPLKMKYNSIIYLFLVYFSANAAENQAERLVIIATMISTAFINLLFICELFLQQYYWFLDPTISRIKITHVTKLLVR